MIGHLGHKNTMSYAITPISSMSRPSMNLLEATDAVIPAVSNPELCLILRIWHEHTGSSVKCLEPLVVILPPHIRAFVAARDSNLGHFQHEMREYLQC